MIWPWLERLEILQTFNDLVLEKEKFAPLFDYIQRMKELEPVKATMNKPQEYARFFEGNISGNIEYDFVLSETDDQAPKLVPADADKENSTEKKD